MLFADYALYGLCVTAFVVFLLAFAGLPEGSAVVPAPRETSSSGPLSRP